MMRMPRLSRPVSLTLGLSTLILVVIYGGMAIWPRIETYQELRALDQQWRNRSNSTAVRIRAVERLTEYGQEAAAYLMAAARDADGRVRARAYMYLGGLDPIPQEALRICLAAVDQDGLPVARASAVVSLGVWATLDRQQHPNRRHRLLEALVRAGRDASPIVRRAAMQAMVGAEAIGIDPCPWLSDVDRSVRLAAADAVLWLDPAHKGRTVPVLQAMIRQAGPARPQEVFQTLRLLVRADRAACRGVVPTFINWLDDQDAGARGRVVLWLAQIGPVASDAVPALEAMLDDGLAADRARVAFAIICVAPTHCERAADCLMTMIGDPGAHPRDRAIALSPINALLNQPRVPEELQQEVLDDLRPIPDQPGIYPALGVRIRRFLEYQEHRRQQSDHVDDPSHPGAFPGSGPRPGPAPVPGHAARLIRTPTNV